MRGLSAVARFCDWAMRRPTVCGTGEGGKNPRILFLKAMKNNLGQIVLIIGFCRRHNEER